MVPKDWNPAYLNDIADKIMVGIASAATHAYTDNGIRMLRNLNIKEGFIDDSDILFVGEEYELQHKNKRLKAGDILTVRTGYPGLSAVVPKKYENAQCFTSLITRLKEDIALPEYICRFINSEYGKKYISSGEAGGAQKNVNASILKKMLIPLPPLPEQRKIAKILSTWDKAISTTERLIDNSKKQKKALMQQLLTGKKRLLDDSGKPFEGEWEEVTLEKLAKYRRGSFPQPYGNPEWVDEVNGYPFIQVYDIDKNMKLKPDTKIKISDAAIDKSVFIPKETVIVSLQGSIGRVAITQYDAYVDRTVLLFQEFIVPMDKVFFAFIIQELFEIEKTKAPGGTIKTITKEVLSNFKVYIPSYNEQQKIASVLINADQEIELLEQQLADLKQEKKALMQQLLTGKRRVKVDDEAAA